MVKPLAFVMMTTAVRDATISVPDRRHPDAAARIVNANSPIIRAYRRIGAHGQRIVGGGYPAGVRFPGLDRFGLVRYIGDGPAVARLSSPAFGERRFIMNVIAHE